MSVLRSQMEVDSLGHGAKAVAILRPVCPDDAVPLWDLLTSTQSELTGMASLPSTAAATQDRCHQSDATLAQLSQGTLHIGEGTSRSVLLVLEDAADGRLLGLTGITCKRSMPNYSVEIGTSGRGRGLSLSGHRRTWSRTELNATFLHADARGKGLGTLLSRGRFLLAARVADQIPNTVASHLRGPFRNGVQAPFWEAFGVRVLPRWSTSDVAEEGLASEPDRIEELAAFVTPVDPGVLDVLGSVNQASLPAFRLLMSEGLRPNGMYDPVDGGPTLVAELATTATWRQRRQVAVVLNSGLDDNRAEASGVDLLIANGEIEGFKVTRARGVVSDGSDSYVGIDSAIARVLGLAAGSTATVVPLAAQVGPEADGGGAVR